MCTRFIHSGSNVINGFNFDIDLKAWKHKIIKEQDRFYIGILMPDGKYHSFLGINKNGNIGTLLYVHGNEAAQYSSAENCMTIAELMEQYIQGLLSFDEAVEIVKTKKITYAPDGSTMQGMLTDSKGRALVIEPGIGYKIEEKPYSLITNYSVLKPESTKPFIVPGDTRYETAKSALDASNSDFTIKDAWTILKSVHQEGDWATRVSFVYSENDHTVYYAENNSFECLSEYCFDKD